MSDSDWRNWLIAREDIEHPLSMEMNTIGNDRILVYSELVPLSTNFDRENSTGKEKIERFSEERILRSQQIAEQPTTETEPGFAASGRCAQCHTLEMAKWSFTSHSRAWESLVTHPVKNSTKNPECIGCHSTGFGQTGG